MRTPLTLVACLLFLIVPISVFGQSSATRVPEFTAGTFPRGIINQPIQPERLHLAFSLGRARLSRTQQPGAQDPSWIRRHPAVFGALVGAGGGAVSAVPRWNELYCTTGGDEDCLFHGGAGALVGAGLGAGVGALIGYFVGRN